MKKLLVLIVSAIFIVGCNNAAKPVAQDTNSAKPPANTEKSQTAIAHTTENQTPPAGNTASKWKQSGDPIDTKLLDTAIATAEVTFKKKPDDAAKKALSEAYYKRADALTAARQYASAIGDYRRTLKYDPNHKEAKDWIEKITMIYDSMNKEAPPEGQEPPPLTLEKGK